MNHAHSSTATGLFQQPANTPPSETTSPLARPASCRAGSTRCRNVQTCETSFLLSLNGRKDDRNAQVSADVDHSCGCSSTLTRLAMSERLADISASVEPV